MKRIFSVLTIVATLLSYIFYATGVMKIFYRSEGKDYSIRQIDLSVKPANVPKELDYLFDGTVVDLGEEYLAHPDSVLLKNGNILTMYPKGHGKGAVLTKITTDGGLTYTQSLTNTPKSWENSRETPTVYRLEFAQSGVDDKLVMISANPKWPGESTTGGFNCSLSEDEGKTWSEFELFYPKCSENGVVPIVAMASLTRLKENGDFADKWMGFFHDSLFNNYKSILTFDSNGKMNWSAPEKYFAEYNCIEKGTNMCEVEVIRSDRGKGDELCLISRSNSKQYNSLISFSSDEGKTWSKPTQAPAALNGERHKAEYTNDGRLVIVFRSIGRSKEKMELYADQIDTKKFYSEGPVAWVGTYEDLKNGAEGQYRIKLAHTYLDGQTQPQEVANADTGYCGNVVLADDTVVISTYGRFSPNETYTDAHGNAKMKTYILSKRFKLADIDKLMQTVS